MAASSASAVSASPSKKTPAKDDIFTAEPTTRVCCIGAGYVGGPTMAVLAEHCPGVTFTTVDINAERIAAWNSDDLPIYEPGLKTLLDRVRGKNLHFSTAVEAEVEAAQIVFIAVNTGTKEYGYDSGSAYDLSAVEAVARSIARFSKSNKIIVEKSTVPVNTADAVRSVVEANKQPGFEHVRFEIVSNPEFLSEGNAIKDLEDPPRVLIGCHETQDGFRAARQVAALYGRWIPPDRIITTNVYSSELSKLACNAVLAQRISSINALSAICERTGANIDQVAVVLGSDPRIGKHFLKASVGFGGSCFRKDILGLMYLCRALRLEEVAQYWEQILLMNEYQKDRFTRTILTSMFGTLRGKKIAVFGFAFKKDTGDHRDSCALFVTEKLVSERCNVAIYDPKVPHETINELFPTVQCYRDAYQAAEGASAILILTEWDEFTTFDYTRMYTGMNKPAFVFDGRNILDHEYLISLGFSVHAIGKRF